MSDIIKDVVLVGGGLASSKAAEALRDRGYDGRITLVTDEPELPYDRPPLSKGFLLGEQSVEDLFIHSPDYYTEHDITLVTGDAVTGIDCAAGQVGLTSGVALPFDRLLLATGSAPRRLPLDGTDLEGVLTLRTLEDSRRLRAHLHTVEHATVIGAGWIGSEVAATARGLGVDVTMVDPLETPLQRVLGERVGGALGEVHARNGVDLRHSVSVSGLSGNQRVSQVILSDGSTIDTQLVIVGIGVQPRTDLAIAAGLAVDGGIVVDETLVTTDPRIFAAGDAASAWNPFLRRQIRVDHWDNALNQGLTAGANMLGAGEVYDRIPYFFSDQYDLGLEYVGLSTDPDNVLVRGSLESGEFIAFWLDDGLVAAAMNVNIWDVSADLQSLIRSRKRFDAYDLENPSIPLGDLLN